MDVGDDGGGRKRKPHERADWYKRYPRSFQEDTRHLTLEERGAYNDILELIYIAEGPIPDDLRTIAHRLHVNVRVWERLRKRLLALGMLFITRGQLHQKAAQRVLKEQADWRKKLGRSAEDSPEIRDMFGEDSPMVQCDLKKSLNDSNGSRSTRSRKLEQELEEELEEDSTLSVAAERQPYAAAEDDELRVLIFEAAKEAMPFGGAANGKLANMTIPKRWLATSCDLHLDVLPTLRIVSARLSGAGTTFSTWGYFTGAVHDARKERTSGRAAEARAALDRVFDKKEGA